MIDHTNNPATDWRDGLKREIAARGGKSGICGRTLDALRTHFSEKCVQRQAADLKMVSVTECGCGRIGRTFPQTIW